MRQFKQKAFIMPTLGGSGGSGGSSGGEEWFNDGNTHIWIHLEEGRTSPMMGLNVNGTVTIDWGDGTEPYELTGTSQYSTVWTTTHEYASPGDYIITLAVKNGKAWFSGSSSNLEGSYFLNHSKTSSEGRNWVYRGSIMKAELGNNTGLHYHAFRNCRLLTSVKISGNCDIIDSNAFKDCYSLSSVTLNEGLKSIGNEAFLDCYSLQHIDIPNSVTDIKTKAFNSCSSLKSVNIPNNIATIGESAFANCHSLLHISIPNGITLSSSVFNCCCSACYFDLTQYTAVPTLSSTYIFYKIPDDCKILVPAVLYDEWIAATNWTTFASQIVAV